MRTKVKHFIFITLFGMIGSNAAWGGAVHYAKLRTEVSSTSTGTGKVYSATSSNPVQMQYQTLSVDSVQMTPDYKSTNPFDNVENNKELRSIQRAAMYAFAKPNKGTRFMGWYRGNEFVSEEILYEDSFLLPYDSTRTGSITLCDTLYAVFEGSLSTSVTYPDASVAKGDITAVKNTTVDVTIGRTFKRNGTDHTICLPFYLDSVELSNSPLTGFNKLQTFESAEIENAGKENETLVLHMQDAKMIEAGKPYLIAWPSGGADIVNPTFTDATITTDQADAVVSGDVSFCGTLVPYAVEKDDKGILFVGTQGVLNWPNVGGNIKAFRSYFSVDLSTGASAPIRRGMAAMLNGDKKVTTALKDTEDSNRSRVRKLMEQGRVVMEVNGVKYDLNGREIMKNE